MMLNCWGVSRIMSRAAWAFVAAIITLTALVILTGTALADDPEPEPESQIVSPKIVGGSVAQVGAWPWQVALLVNGLSPFNGQFCGGSLITDEWVITAAHCMFVDGVLEQPADIDVQAGIHTLSSNAGQRRDLSSIVVHPSYDPGTFNFDIALVKLSSPVILNSTVSTIIPLVPQDGALADPGVTATVTGWGRISAEGDFSDELLQVEVPIVSTSDCNSSTSYNGSVTANMLCAGSIEDGGIDSCQGDSGGPLVVPDGTGWRLAGVVSWGIGCALPQKPGVYTRVTEMRDFISQNTGVFSTDISLTKTVSPVTEQPGGELTYTITVSNLGPGTATGVTVTEPLPAGLTLVSATTTQGTCSGTQIVTCNVGDLVVTSSASLTVKTKVDSGFFGTITNTATTTTTTVEANAQNNSASASASIPPADLKITKTAPAGPVLAGSEIVYTIQVTNNGPATSTNTTITDELPAGVTLVEAIPTQGSCSGTTKVTCDLGQLLVGETAGVSVKVSIATSTRGQLVNVAVASSTAPDNVLGNNTATAVTQIPSVGAWGMASLTVLLGMMFLWKFDSRRKTTG